MNAAIDAYSSKKFLRESSGRKKSDGCDPHRSRCTGFQSLTSGWLIQEIQDCIYNKTFPRCAKAAGQWRSRDPNRFPAQRAYRLQSRRAQCRAALARRRAAAMRAMAQGLPGMIRIDAIWLALGASDLRADMDTPCTGGELPLL